MDSIPELVCFCFVSLPNLLPMFGLLFKRSAGIKRVFSIGAILGALLAAAADPNIRNFTGHTAVELLYHLGGELYPHVEAALAEDASAVQQRA